MGSPESGAGASDCSVGSIVWVRRRNGSWWPGKILSSDELSASHVMSPRSGTPVKLLGREDASVDWYNLEKSKRVKAFRCGEFDDCIERAEASQGMPPKKREKYARREDAILHALELEREMLEKIFGKGAHSYHSKSRKASYDLKRELTMSSENLEIGNRRELHCKTHQGRKSLPLTIEDKIEDQDLWSDSAKEENQFSAEDDNPSVLSRMRGLQDIGLRTAPSNLNTSTLSPLNGSHKPVSVTNVHDNVNGGLGTEGAVSGNSENLLEKRKRSHDSLCGDSIAKRRDRRRPLVQVLQNSSKLSDSHSQLVGSANFTSMSDEEEQPGLTFHAKRSRYAYLTSDSRDKLNDAKSNSTCTAIVPVKFEESICLQHNEMYEEHNIGSVEDTETDSSDTDSLDSDSDSDDLVSISEGAVSIELQPKYPGKSEARHGYASASSEEIDELALTDDMSHPSHIDPASTSMGVSQWQLKGKRNNRSLLKRLPDGSNRKLFRGSTDETTPMEMGISGRNYMNLGPPMALYGSRCSDGISSRNMQWEHWDWSHQSAIKGYWEDSGEYFDPAIVINRQHSGGRIMLVDVDLKVQSSYQREHVPIISLLSKINGQAIVGHPIQIEALKNGSSESLLLETDEWCPEILENDAALSPMWRTARRTANFRVPRPDLSSTYDESTKHLQFVDGRKGSSGRLNAGTLGLRTGTMAKRITSSALDRKISRKPLKKISLSANQKIRTLSSIDSQPKQNSDSKRVGNTYDMDGLIKPESLPTALACIPVKLVFSRLQEELVGRHP